jgi:hypothetical protein
MLTWSNVASNYNDDLSHQTHQLKTAQCGHCLAQRLAACRAAPYPGMVFED